MMEYDKFEDRFKYLKIGGKIGYETFGSHRYLNQLLYTSKEWRDCRREVIIRDNGCDLAHEDHMIYDKILIHHIEPITLEDIQNRSNKIFDLNNLVSVSFKTHNAIHYGDDSLLIEPFVIRTKNDTCPWR